ncbi:hypothetical protein [Sphingomonas sp. R86520]|uniref:hypothetical protein n=1 Tax=Sphingomonas sp. R86520 TaxID=3093859 RepID=UPI0036D40803
MAHAPYPADPQPHHPAQHHRLESVPPSPRRTPGDEPPIPDHLPDAVRHVLAWQAHVDAGRIGTRIPVSPEIAANRDRWTALARTMRK